MIGGKVEEVFTAIFAQWDIAGKLVSYFFENPKF
jgi:hypothetical protein